MSLNNVFYFSSLRVSSPFRCVRYTHKHTLLSDEKKANEWYVHTAIHSQTPINACTIHLPHTLYVHIRRSKEMSTYSIHSKFAGLLFSVCQWLFSYMLWIGFFFAFVICANFIYTLKLNVVRFFSLTNAFKFDMCIT